jgi:hypothetical protein
MEQRLTERIDIIMAAQDDINAAVAQIDTTDADIATQVTNIGAVITAIQAWIAEQPASVDTSALVTAMGALSASQATLDSAVTAAQGTVPPAPAP